jgi:C1A family cysteine protease
MPLLNTISIPKYHWKRGPIDASAPKYNPPPELTASLPASIDLRQYCSPIEDQGQLGSCTGNAIAGVVEYYDIKSGKATVNNPLRVSRLFIYYQERVIENDVNYDNGAYIHDGITAMYTYGACQETLWPYVISRFSTRPSTAAYADALNRKATSYQQCANFTTVKTAISQGWPVVIGFDVYASFESGTWWQPTGTGLMPYPNVNREQLLGGHCVSLVGYNDNLTGPAGKGYFIARNSWGTSWGQHGYFYMPYQVIQNTNMSSDFWIISTVHNP